MPNVSEMIDDAQTGEKPRQIVSSKGLLSPEKSKDDEVNSVILSREFAVEMEKMFAGDLAESDQIKWEDWKVRPLADRLGEWIAHLFAHWL